MTSGARGDGDRAVMTGKEMGFSGDYALRAYCQEETSLSFQHTLCDSLNRHNVVALEMKRCPGANIQYLSVICHGPRTADVYLKLCALLKQLRCVLVLVDMEEGAFAEMHYAKIVSFGPSADYDEEEMPRNQRAGGAY